ncbi:hypothetical protein C2E23DRAFT_866854 [Lenzites betulinus]|nr:hypothetical protein C2E23DRAFT_866854 [Lenzites betulinus]
MLRITSSVLSGSTALHILDNERAAQWSPSDLNIYTPRHGLQAFVDYLCASEGYSVTKIDTSKYPYDNSSIEKVVHLQRTDHEIDVIQSSSSSALEPIPLFWSSHLMNYLTADGFCVAYPTYTLSGRGLLNPFKLVGLQIPPPRSINAMEKYVARGYNFRARPLAWIFCSYCSLGRL